MEIIEWSDEFSLGVGLFDQHHKQLLDLVNRLIDPTEGGEDRATVAIIIAELLQVAYDHFAYEEKVLLQYGYSDTQTHKQHHDAFIKRTEALREAVKLGVTKVPDWIVILVRQWFAKHILEEDMKYKTLSQGKWHTLRRSLPVFLAPCFNLPFSIARFQFEYRKSVRHPTSGRCQGL